MAIGKSTDTHQLSKQIHGRDPRSLIVQLVGALRRKCQSGDLGDCFPAVGADAGAGSVEQMRKCVDTVEYKNCQGELDGNAVGRVSYSEDSTDNLKFVTRSNSVNVSGEYVVAGAREPLSVHRVREAVWKIRLWIIKDST